MNEDRLGEKDVNAIHAFMNNVKTSSARKSLEIVWEP